MRCRRLLDLPVQILDALDEDTDELNHKSPPDPEWPEGRDRWLPFGARSVLDPDTGACERKRARSPAKPFVTPPVRATAPGGHTPARCPADQTTPALAGSTPSGDRSID